jgi:hypothetical protein
VRGDTSVKEGDEVNEGESLELYFEASLELSDELLETWSCAV